MRSSVQAEKYDPSGTLIVAEVVSPSSERLDTVDKVGEYFSVPSIVHYLIVNPTNEVLYHERGKDPVRYESGEMIDLTPPGLAVPVADLLPEIG